MRKQDFNSMVKDLKSERKTLTAISAILFLLFSLIIGVNLYNFSPSGNNALGSEIQMTNE